jgi:chromosome segregation ATPase
MGDLSKLPECVQREAQYWTEGSVYRDLAAYAAAEQARADTNGDAASLFATRARQAEDRVAELERTLRDSEGRVAGLEGDSRHLCGKLNEALTEVARLKVSVAELERKTQWWQQHGQALDAFIYPPIGEATP